MAGIEESKSKISDAVSHFESELNKLRAGRPTPETFSQIQVEAYGSQMGLESLSNINIVDASLVTIQPYDKATLGAIEKAIQSSDLGYNPQVDGELIRIPIPPMTQEKREEVVKKLKQMGEEAKISVRVARKEGKQELDRSEEAGDIAEDQKNSLEKQLQVAVDDANRKIDELVSAKEESLMQL
ncbi:MAG: ribosome recycling factor [Candidatus Dojkabacteria bacterium]